MLLYSIVLYRLLWQKQQGMRKIRHENSPRKNDLKVHFKMSDLRVMNESPVKNHPRIILWKIICNKFIFCEDFSKLSLPLYNLYGTQGLYRDHSFYIETHSQLGVSVWPSMQDQRQRRQLLQVNYFSQICYDSSNKIYNHIEIEWKFTYSLLHINSDISFYAKT